MEIGRNYYKKEIALKAEKYDYLKSITSELPIPKLWDLNPDPDLCSKMGSKSRSRSWLSENGISIPISIPFFYDPDPDLSLFFWMNFFSNFKITKSDQTFEFLAIPSRIRKK